MLEFPVLGENFMEQFYGTKHVWKNKSHRSFIIHTSHVLKHVFHLVSIPSPAEPRQSVLGPLPVLRNSHYLKCILKLRFQKQLFPFVRAVSTEWITSL